MSHTPRGLADTFYAVFRLQARHFQLATAEAEPDFDAICCRPDSHDISGITPPAKDIELR